MNVDTGFQLQYEPGATIQYSGIYRVSHERHHTIILDVVCEKGGKFPECKMCKATFTLIHRYSQLSDIFPK